MNTYELRNPHDHDRLICIIDEKSPTIEILNKGWLIKVEFKDKASPVVTYNKQNSVTRR